MSALTICLACLQRHGGRCELSNDRFVEIAHIDYHCVGVQHGLMELHWGQVRACFV